MEREYVYSFGPACVCCGTECSGMGRCSICGEAMCFICANFVGGLGGERLCDGCLEKRKGVVMRKGVHLSPTHGVNPSLLQCFVCGKDVGVALMGRLPGDEEAPRKVCLDHEPCEECEEWMKQGIILISVDEEKSKKDLKNPWRTGGWVVVKEEAVRRMIGDPALLEQICKKRMAFLPDEVWDMLRLPRGKEEAPAST